MHNFFQFLFHLILFHLELTFVNYYFEVLLLNNLFIDKTINYTYKEYIEHLKLTNEYAKNNKNYNILTEKDKTFKNITITILKNNHVIISKNSNPTIHFVIRHPKLVAAIESFNPLVKEL